MKLKELIVSILHLKSIYSFLINASVALIAGVLAYLKLLILENTAAFEAITWVVGVDFAVGVILALKRGEFETQKALKVLYYFGVYFTLTGMVIKVEEGFPSAFWLSEALLMPLLVGQIVSIAKNLTLLKLITNPTLVKILANIDKHKDTVKDETPTNSN